MRPLAGRYRVLPLLVALAVMAGCAPTSASPTPTVPAPTDTPTDTPAPQATPTLTPAPVLEPTPWPRADERNRMVDTQIAARDVSDPVVLRAMRRVPRHEFVPEEYQSSAYEDHPLPIGHGQTISQPFIVAWMTELLALKPTDRVLEIGTGSGYQAAILAEIVHEVYTIEIIGALADQAETRLKRLGYTNITVRHADGYFGWEEHAPFDAIIVTAAPDHVPPPLLNQLKDGGHLVIPVGPPGSYQSLWLYVRQGDEYTTTNMGGVIFVPLTREEREE